MTKSPWYETVLAEHLDALRPGGQWVSSRVAAGIIGRGKTAAAEFMAWVKTRPDADGQPGAPETLSVSDKSKTWVEDGIVFTNLGDYGIKTMSQGEFRAIKRDYSRHYGGHAMSRAEVTLQYGFPTIKAFELFARIHELRQNGLPFTDAEIAEDGIEALAEKSVESQRQALYLRITEKEREAEKRDALKWRSLELSIQAIVRAGVQPLPARTVPAAPQVPGTEPYALVISLSDLHLGKLAFNVHGDVIWNRALAAEAALHAVANLLAKAQRLGAPESIVLMICSDGVHVDGPALTTTAGTRQGEQSEGTYRQMVEDYLQMIRQAVELCRAVAPLHLVAVEGNHDQVTSMMIGLFLEQLYKDDEAVTVLRQRAQGMVVASYGDTTLAFTHGDYLPRGAAAAGKLWSAISALTREIQLPLGRHLLSFGGHLHHEQTTDHGGLIHHTLMSLTPPDEWHRRAHWTGSNEGAQAFVIRRSGGKSAVLYSDPEPARAS